MPTGQRPFVILADTPDMALRVGRRRDPEAVLLTIHAEKAESRGKLFQRFQEHLYLVDSLSPDLFTGPPLPKEKPEKEKKKEPAQTKPSATPGSFAVRPEFIPGLTPSGEKDKLAKKKRSDVPDWKKAQRKERRRQNQDDD
jgi:putative RNA 2'-phosphotransferase